MNKDRRIIHVDTRESIERSLKQAGVWGKLHRAIEDLKSLRRVVGLPSSGKSEHKK